MNAASNSPRESIAESMRPGDQSSIAIGICTYRRKSLLLRTIEYLKVCARDFGEPVTLIVVDNDGKDSTLKQEVEAAAQDASIAAVHFEVESTPGISAARNQVLKVALAGKHECLCFIDDDEWPSKTWLKELNVIQKTSGAWVVGGPVTPVFAVNAERFSKVSSFWAVGPQLRDGKPYVYATGNCLIKLDVLREIEAPYFKPEFGLTGGEDAAFFHALYAKGVSMAWANDAIVFEEIPQDRANMTWMRNRRYRIGISMAQLEMSEKGRARALIKTLALTARLAIYPLLGREPASPWVGWWFEAVKIFGRWAAHFGQKYYAYARSP
jgi:succinoglycan biosynthesis protein ExoM